MFDGEAGIGPGMKDAWFGEPVAGQPHDPLPVRHVFLAAPPQRVPPEVDDKKAERGQRPTVGRHGVVVEPARDDLPQPNPLLGKRLMHTLTQRRLDFPQLRPHAVASGLP